MDPVTYKVLTNNTHIVALKTTGNVFAYDTVERLNIKAKVWRDLVSDEGFSRKDIIVIQDPQNLESRNIASFKHQQDGVSTLTPSEEAERNNPIANVNTSALGNTAKILKAKEAVAQARVMRNNSNPNHNPSIPSKTGPQSKATTSRDQTSKPLPYNAARYTTGKAAASFTSTGVSVHTAADRALLTEEEYMLQIKRVPQTGYARLSTSLGDLNIELRPEFAPKAVWNFIHLANRGYYNSTKFHRNIPNFMIQGGDPTGTGRGGTSIWTTPFKDEFDGPLKHDSRGTVSMANKGKDTNSSQFFILYRAAKHLDRKHTIFGHIVDDAADILSKLENAPVRTDNDSNTPLQDIVIKSVTILINPFDEFQKARKDKDFAEQTRLDIAKQGGTEDDRTTWTGKRVRRDGRVDLGAEADGVQGVGKYLKGTVSGEVDNGGDEVVEEWEEVVAEEPVRKKVKAGAGFGDFSGW